MWAQVGTIAWAQLRAARNHLPRTTFGSLLGFAISLVWYGGFGALAVFIATTLPFTPIHTVRTWLASWLFCVFLFWQLVPLFTLSGGWSLDRRKLQVYPISNGTLLLTETVLRVTASLEMLLVLLGICVGLLQRPDLPLGAALWLLLYIPFNLLLALAIRDFSLRVFRRRKLQEVFAIFIVCLAVGPQILLRSGNYTRFTPAFLWMANGVVSPWHNVAAVAFGSRVPTNVLLTFAWIGLAYVAARRQFVASLLEEEPLRVAVPSAGSERERLLGRLFEWFNQRFADPLAALIVKEIRALMRMPRFRVVFMLSTLFAVLILIPAALKQDGPSFFGRNFLPIMNVYGLLILGDALMWNVFGFDRTAAQTYFIVPVDLSLVFRAKNIVSVFFMTLQTSVVIVFAFVLRLPVTLPGILTSVFAALVMGTCFLAIGNLSSVIIPRAVDPRSTMRKQGGATIQLWLLGASIGAVVLTGGAFLAGWALRTPWATIAVLMVELVLALVTYRIATDSAVSRGVAHREEILAALSKGSSLVSG